MPGVQVNPLKRGLYTLKHATLTLGNLKLRLAGHLPEMGGPAQSADTGPLIAQFREMLGACDIAGATCPRLPLAVIQHVLNPFALFWLSLVMQADIRSPPCP